MPRSLSARRSGLSVAAAVVLLTACGGSDDDPAASPTGSSASETSATESAGAAGSQFCTEAADLQDEIAATFTGQSGPDALPTVLRSAAEDIRQMEPPAELAADWTSFGDGIEQLAAAAAQVDFTDPEAVAAFQAQVPGLGAGFGEASVNVDTYLSEECGLGGDGAEPAAPTG
jgi:hypothetical protein